MATRFLTVAAILAALLVMPQSSLGQTVIESDTASRLEAIEADEQAVAAELFTLEQEIEEVLRQETEASVQIAGIESDKKAISKRIGTEKENLSKHRQALAALLVTYQKTGPGTFLEILLNAESLTDFIRRVNLLRDMTRKTGEAMDAIDAVTVRLAREEEALEEKQAELIERQKQLEAAIREKQALVLEQEAYLESLQEARSSYEALLSDIRGAWEGLKPVFAQASTGFTQLAESGGLPPDAVRTTYTIKGIRARISDDAFNKAIADNSLLPDMVFDFSNNVIVLTIDKRHLVLKGSFDVIDRRILSFTASEGSFYGLPLSMASIDDLFKEGKLEMDLAPLLEGNDVLGAESVDGDLVLAIGLRVF